MKKYISWPLALSITALLLTSCSDGAPDASKLLSVKTAKAEISSIDDELSINGVFAPLETENITTKLSGAVLELNASVGQYVKPGDLLIKIDTKELEAQLNQARIALTITIEQATVAKTNLDAADAGVSSAQSGVTSALNSVSSAKAVLADQREQAALNLKAAQDAYDATEATIADQIRLASESLEAAQAAYDLAALSYEEQFVQLIQNIDNAQDNYDRIKKLHDAFAATDSELRNAQNALTAAINAEETARISADAAFLSAETRLSQAKTALEQAQGSSANAQRVAAQSRLDAAQTTYDQANDAASESQVIAAESQLAAAELQVTAAEARVDTAAVQYETASTSAIEQAQAAIETLETQMSNAEIRAHQAGVIVNVNIHMGELANPGLTLISTADVSTLKLTGTVAQQYIPYLPVSGQVKAYSDIFPHDLLIGTVKMVGPLAVATGGYFPIEIHVDNKDGRILAGSSGRAAVRAEKSDVVTVPADAVIVSNGETYVFVVEGGIAKKCVIEAGLANTDAVEVLSGLASGANVAVTNTNAIVDGMEVAEVRE